MKIESLCCWRFKGGDSGVSLDLCHQIYEQLAVS